MITINVVAVGNLKEKFWEDAVKEYTKRIGAYAKINIVEIKESVYGNSAKEIEIAKQKEAEKLKKYMQGYCVALEVKGETYTSEGFAEHIENLSNKGVSTINFFIGGSYGLDQTFSKQLNENMSFSKFTFPHQLMRVILLEQIYRAFTIINNKTYHK